MTVDTLWILPPPIAHIESTSEGDPPTTSMNRRNNHSSCEENLFQYSYGHVTAVLRHTRKTANLSFNATDTNVEGKYRLVVNISTGSVNAKCQFSGKMKVAWHGGGHISRALVRVYRVTLNLLSRHLRMLFNIIQFDYVLLLDCAVVNIWLGLGSTEHLISVNDRQWLRFKVILAISSANLGLPCRHNPAAVL